MRYVALLRGIGPMNPNMRNEHLRRVVEELGMENVATVITTGNVVFDSPSRSTRALEARIEAAWPERLGFHSTTIVRSRRRLVDLVQRDPFAGFEDTPETSFQVTFLKHAATTELTAPHTGRRGAFTILSIHDGAVCSILDSTSPQAPDLMRWLERAHGKEITTRTWKTVHRILRKLG